MDSPHHLRTMHPPTTRAVVLFSGGQDSTTCLYWAKARFSEVRAVSVHYGQRHEAELDAAREIAELAGVRHDVFELGVLGELGGSALVDGTELRGSGGHVDAEMPEGLPTSYVPLRNGFLLHVAAAVAAKWGARSVVTGVCQTDFSGYPDCRRAYIDSLERAITLALPSSLGPMSILTPLMELTKAQTVELARTLPGCWDALARSVTCYHGRRPGCGVCPACELRERGFVQAGEKDPAAAG